MPYHPNREQLACAAGFFNGEGSTHAAHNKPRLDGKKLSYVQLSLSQSGIYGYEPLSQFHEAIGRLGQLYGPWPPAKNQRKIRWQYEINGHEKTQAVIAMLWPWLSTEKRTQAKAALSKHIECRRA